MTLPGYQDHRKSFTRILPGYRAISSLARSVLNGAPLDSALDHAPRAGSHGLKLELDHYHGADSGVDCYRAIADSCRLLSRFQLTAIQNHADCYPIFKFLI